MCMCCCVTLHPSELREDLVAKFDHQESCDSTPVQSDVRRVGSKLMRVVGGCNCPGLVPTGSSSCPRLCSPAVKETPIPL